MILYRSKSLRQYQYFVAPEWPGGIYASPTMAGSRPGALVAASYAAMIRMGREGYVSATKDIVTTARRIRDAVSGMKDVFVYGHPITMNVAIGSNSVNVYSVSDAMSARGNQKTIFKLYYYFY